MIIKYIPLQILLISCLLSFSACFSVKAPETNSTPVKHDKWDVLLKKYVAADGLVNYQGFIADSIALNDYLKDLSSAYPNDKNWSKTEQLAYWINAYNAFTVKMIIQHYPVASIKDIAGKIPFVNTVWDDDFIRIEGKKLSLNQIEHSILRKEYEEPRIHFAVNCASFSCPKLLNAAFTSKQLETQLTQQAIDFINDPFRNEIEVNQPKLSKIFSWFKGDFTKKTSLIAFINQYATVKIKADANIEYKDYFWRLNEVK